MTRIGSFAPVRLPSGDVGDYGDSLSNSSLDAACALDAQLDIVSCPAFRLCEGTAAGLLADSEAIAAVQPYPTQAAAP